MKQNYCLNNICGLQKMRATVYRSTVLTCRSFLKSFLSIRNILASLWKQADLEAERAPTWGIRSSTGRRQRHSIRLALNSDSAPGKTDASYAIKNWPHSTKHFFSQVSQGNKAYMITMYFLHPAPPASFESLGIHGSRELPKTRVLTALALGLAPLVASKLAGSRHSSRLSPAQPRGTQSAQALPWTSVLENLEKQPVLLGGRVEEREEQIIDRFW